MSTQHQLASSLNPTHASSTRDDNSSATAHNTWKNEPCCHGMILALPCSLLSSLENRLVTALCPQQIQNVSPVLLPGQLSQTGQLRPKYGKPKHQRPQPGAVVCADQRLAYQALTQCMQMGSVCRMLHTSRCLYTGICRCCSLYPTTRLCIC